MKALLTLLTSLFLILRQSLNKIFLIALPAFGGYYLGFTAQGLQALAQGVCWYLGGALSIDAITGTLFSPIHIQGLRYTSPHHATSIEDLRIHWQPAALFHKQFMIYSLTARDMHIKMTDTTRTEPSGSFPFPWKNVLIQKLSLNQVHIQTPTQNIIVPTLTLLAQEDLRKMQYDAFFASPPEKTGLHYLLRTTLHLTSQTNKKTIVTLACDGRTIRNRLHIAGCSIQSQGNQLTVSGTLGQSSTLTWQLKIPTLTPWDLPLQGSITGYGKLAMQSNRAHTTLKLYESTLNLRHAPEYTLTLQPTLTLALSQKEPALTGKIHITQANLHLHDFNSTVSLPNEAIITTHKKTPTPLPAQCTLDIALILDKPAAVTSKQFQGNIAGNLTLYKKSSEAPTAQGTLYTTSGLYHGYNQNLTIQEGKLLYTGNLLSNPGLLVRAEKSFKRTNMIQGAFQFFGKTNLENTYMGSSEVRVGVQISGTLDDPIVSLYSRPEDLSQMDKLSYLLFGQPQVPGNNAALLLALSNLSSGDTSPITTLTSDLKSFLHVDNLSIGSEDRYDPGTNSTVPTTMLGIGKQLGDNLYLQYQLGVFQPASIISIIYQLTQHVSIRSEISSEDTGADLLYTIEKR